jgi:uncharacterized BrkB/YihY/UPF0761 family membrane protein
MTSGSRRAGKLLATSAINWNANNASTTGAALAFYSAFSLAPLLVIILTLTGGVASFVVLLLWLYYSAQTRASRPD